MTKRLFFILGVFAGFFFAEVLRRKQKERLNMLEEKESRHKARYAKYERDWQKEIANMPFEERMDYELFEAGLKHDGWIGDDGDEES